MRFANNNKAIINKLTKKSIKSNKLRNIFAIIAISLTTILFTSLFTISMGMLKSMEQQTMRQTGGYAHGTFKYLTTEQFEKLKDHPLIKEFGYSIIVNMAENEEFLKHHTEIRYATDTQAKMYFSTPTKGKMPQKENEISTDTMVLDLLSVPHKIGEKVNLEYKIGEETISKEFILTGFWEYDDTAPCSMVFVSRKFIDRNIEGVNIDTAAQKSIGSGLTFLDVLFKNSRNIEQKMKKVLLDNGFSINENAPNHIKIGINWAYMSTNFTMDLSTIISIVSVLLLIIFTGYLIIYNIFQISVTKDIRFYGLLKTIGTTPKQIKRIVIRQGFLLCIIGIPVGLIIGYIMGNILLPIIMNSFTISTTSISFSPIIFIGATIFSLITVFISCRKPGKIASNVSPIEATKYIDVNSYTRKKKKSSKGKKIYNMAIYNILRNKKKSFVLILSMSLSLILFNSVFTFTKGFNMDKYLSHFIIADFIAGSANYFNDNQFRSINDTPSEQMINSIDALNGIENSGRIYYSIEEINSDVDNESRVQLYGLEDFPLSLLNIYEGEVDLEKLKSGNYIIEGVNSDDNGKIIYESSKYSIGDKVRITFENNNTNEYEVIVKAELKHNMSARYYLGDSSTMYLTSNKFIDEIKNPLTMCYLLNVEDQYINKTESFLYNYTNNINPQMDYESKEKLVDDFKSFQNMFLLVGSVLSFIIGIIGILNFINSILTSIISRRREFAMLQSIGMTKKQLNKMILLEGLFYAIITISISIVLGSIISYTVVSSIAGNIWFFKYKFIIHPILITSPILIIISILVPFIANLKMNNQTIVERLREVE